MRLTFFGAYLFKQILFKRGVTDQISRILRKNGLATELMCPVNLLHEWKRETTQVDMYKGLKNK